MEKHFKLLTDQVILQLDRKLSEIQIVLEEEKQKIIAWNKTERSYSHVYTVHEMFENMSQKRPSSIALIYDNNTLTYSELDKLSSKFAGYLQTANIQSGAIIGICVERSFNLIIAQLAVLKVGASIVPLETDEQNKHTAINKLKMANCTAVIVDINTQKMFMEHSIKVCILTHEILSSMEFNFNNISVDPFNTALIPFTSGTTGVPKGIVVRHVGWHNWAEVLREYVNEHDKVFYTSPFTFDASFWEIFSLTLAQGATLVMCHAKERIDINALVTLFNRNSATIATFTPSVLSMLSPEKFPTLRMIFVTGENLPKVLVDKWIKAGIRVINGYGQTEMTAGETLFECTLQSDIYIGKPIANTEILILDENNQLLPINVWGEICVGGLGISQYLGRDDLNKQKFITHPFNSSRKLFRTGDVGRYLHDGTLALKGRIEDQKQIKIYGVRVELEEIEDALTLHPDVQAAAVKVWGERENAFIAAYIVLKKYVPELNEKSIQEFLRKIKALDNLKIPKNFTVLASLPTNSNGKLDKTRLPKPIFKIAPMQDIWRVASKMERDVLEIIKKVFPMLEVSDLNADLVDLGMNSFQVVRMVHLLNQTLLSKQAQKLKVNELIRPITVKEISAIIDKKLKAIPTTNIELDKFAISMV